MSSKTYAVRRLSLLAGSSAGAAAIAVLAFTGAAMAPGAAFAANECSPVGVSPSDNGNAADTYNCLDFIYTAGGITYSSNGALTVNGGFMLVGQAGINLIANNGDSVTLNITPGGGGITGTAGAVLEVLSTDASAAPGALNISIGDLTGSNANVTYGINAVATNGAAININADAVGASRISGGSQLSAIRAISTGGNGDVAITTLGSVIGRLRGIEAQSSGTGTLTIVASGPIGTQSTATAVAAIDARSGTGLLTIDLSSGSGLVIGSGGLGILASTGGNAVINVGADQGVLGGGVNSSVGIKLTAAGSISLANAGRISGGETGRSLQASALGITLTNSGTITGQLDLAGITGAATFNNTGVFSGAIDLSGLTGNATITHGANADWTAKGENTFGAGLNTISTAGVMNVQSVATFTGVDQFTNSGVIYMGGATAGVTGDVLSLQGVEFIAAGDSRVAMDVNFSGAQAECSTGAVADCLDVSGGSTSGSTAVTIRYAAQLGASSSSNIVLIEGSSAADDFVLDPASDGYTVTADGPTLVRDLYNYQFVYDEEAQNHVLAATPGDALFQPATYTAAAQEIWRSTTGSWFERQADLRANPDGLEGAGGVWGRLGVGSHERENELVAGQRLTDAVSRTSYRQTTSHILFGGDFVGAAGGDSIWVLGATAGFVRSDAEYEGPAAEVSYTGFTGGVYASWIAGPLFVDANLNTNILDVVSDIPSLGLDDNVNLTQTIESLGARMEAGWRFPLAQAYVVEPLVGAEYVRTRGDDVEMENSPTFGSEEDATSLRAGVGLRVGADLGLLGQAASYTLTSRYWEELEGENASLLLGSDPTTIVDDFSGSFAEIDAGVNLYSADGVVSGFLNLGGKFADGYSSVDASIGMRMRW